jgi:hypothetical protein
MLPGMDDITREELQAWIEETERAVERYRSLRLGYLATAEGARRGYAARHGFVNLTDLTQSLVAAKSNLERYRRALAKMS